MNESVEILKTALDACTLRQKVLAHNLANASTAGYKRKDVNFKKLLKDAVNAENIAEIRELKPEVGVDRDAARKTQGNNVSIQKELAVMTENKLIYGLAARAISGKFVRMRKVINGK